MKVSMELRFVNRDGRLVLQQWYDCEGWEHRDYLKNGGEWRDVSTENEEDVD